MPEMPEDHQNAAKNAAKDAGEESRGQAGSDGPVDDLKARMRAALDRKQGKERGVAGGGHKREKAPETHGPLGGVHMHRRKSGGGGA